MKKYNINDFYVGKLVFVIPFGNRVSTEQDSEKAYKIMESYKLALRNGAIDTKDNQETEYTDYLHHVLYESVFTIFYRFDENRYCSLHVIGSFSDEKDKGIDNQGDYFCENLGKFTDYLPKFDFSLPKQISIDEALKLFNTIFKKKTRPKYNGDIYCIDDFYTGTLDYCTSTQVRGKYIRDDERLIRKNTGIELLLENNHAKKIDNSSRESFTELSNNKRIEQLFTKYGCVFLRVGKDEFYNLNNFQLYHEPNSVIKIQRPLGYQLGFLGIYCNGDEPITIPKVLKLQDRLNKKKLKK